jgi:hypothetical protein
VARRFLPLFAGAALWLVSGCRTDPSAAENPLTRLLGHEKNQGTFFVGDTAVPTTAESICEPLGQGDSIMCHGHAGPKSAWLEVYQWNAKTGWITKTLLNTTPGERIVVMRGMWNGDTNTLALQGVIRSSAGVETPVRCTRLFRADGTARFRCYATVDGRERPTLDVVSWRT